jgi:hypothetical protein
MRNRLTAAALLLLAGTPARTHRLDEYLQGTLISVEKTRLTAQMTLTPGVAVYPFVLAAIDTDSDGVISETEQRAYAWQVLRDLLLTVDGRPVSPQLVSVEFPAIDAMKEGRGEIRIEYRADLPNAGPNRKLRLVNHHQSPIAAYQVNCLVPRDPDIRIVAQNRNYSQSHYELDYEQAGDRGEWAGGRGLGVVAFLLFARFASQWRQRNLCSPQRHRDTEFCGK